MCARNILSLPIPTRSTDYPIVQYADDTLIVLPALDSQLIALKDMLHNFAASTGLRVNFTKSSLIPINMSEEEGARIAALLGCSVGSMPFTYLGLPMGTSRPTIYDLLPLVDRIERRLSATSCLLNQVSRLQLLQSALTSMPIYFLCSLSIPQGILKQIERIERQCLWRGNTETPRQSLAAWELVCKPKKYGGLGVTHLGVQNEALLLKHLFMFFNKKDVPWVNLIWDSYYHSSPPQVTQLCGSFWWRDVLKLYEKFVLLATPQVHAGDTVVFWLDRWQIDNRMIALKDRFPRLHSFAIDDTITVKDFFFLSDGCGRFSPTFLFGGTFGTNTTTELVTAHTTAIRGE